MTARPATGRPRRRDGDELLERAAVTAPPLAVGAEVEPGAAGSRPMVGEVLAPRRAGGLAARSATIAALGPGMTGARVVALVGTQLGAERQMAATPAIAMERAGQVEIAVVETKVGKPVAPAAAAVALGGRGATANATGSRAGRETTAGRAAAARQAVGVKGNERTAARAAARVIATAATAGRMDGRVVRALPAGARVTGRSDPVRAMGPSGRVVVVIGGLAVRGPGAGVRVIGRSVPVRAMGRSGRVVVVIGGLAVRGPAVGVRMIEGPVAGRAVIGLRALVVVMVGGLAARGPGAGVRVIGRSVPVRAMGRRGLVVRMIGGQATGRAARGPVGARPMTEGVRGRVTGPRWPAVVMVGGRAARVPLCVRTSGLAVGVRMIEGPAVGRAVIGLRALVVVMVGGLAARALRAGVRVIGRSVPVRAMGRRGLVVRMIDGQATGRAAHGPRMAVPMIGRSEAGRTSGGRQVRDPGMTNGLIARAIGRSRLGAGET